MAPEIRVTSWREYRKLQPYIQIDDVVETSTALLTASLVDILNSAFKCLFPSGCIKPVSTLAKAHGEIRDLSCVWFRIR